MVFSKKSLLFFILSTFLAINTYASETSDQAPTKISDQATTTINGAKQTLQQQNPSFLKRAQTWLANSIKTLANTPKTFVKNHPAATYLICVVICTYSYLALRYYFVDKPKFEKMHEEFEKAREESEKFFQQFTYENFFNFNFKKNESPIPVYSKDKALNIFGLTTDTINHKIIAKQYHTLSQIFHPDHCQLPSPNECAIKMQELNNAYEILKEAFPK